MIFLVMFVLLVLHLKYIFLLHQVTRVKNLLTDLPCLNSQFRSYWKISANVLRKIKSFDNVKNKFISQNEVFRDLSFYLFFQYDSS